jgi:tetratricopeptide (TPR) repeat protein
MVDRDRMGAVVMVFLLSLGASASVELEAAEGFAREGDRAYEAGEFAEAVQAYDAALLGGLDLPDLHYNLANAHYKEGDLGRAVAGYMRTLRRDPRHQAARENLAYAQSQQRDEAFQALELPLFLMPFAWIYDRVSIDEWSLASIILAFGIAAMLIGAQWGLWGRKLRGRAVGLLVPALLLTLVLSGIRYDRDLKREHAVVVEAEVDVRSGPGSEYNLSFKVHEGLQLFVSDRRGEWMQIHLGGELVGWIHADQLETI